jgi:hypothetical protein
MGGGGIVLLSVCPGDFLKNGFEPFTIFGECVTDVTSSAY